MKRPFDFLLALAGLLLLSPLLLVVMLLVWLQDRHSPLYIAPRVGRDGRLFKMVKLRSMVTGADRSGVESTSASDSRITPLGRFVRRYKLDELTQLWNVFIGDMSLVGPRPNTLAGTEVYTGQERALLSIRPGITDFASIVFSDEGEILRDEPDPDLAYDRLIRPWKSRLGLIYLENRSLYLDIRLIFYTLLSVVSKKTALNHVVKCLRGIGADETIIHVARRELPLQPSSPPGTGENLSQS